MEPATAQRAIQAALSADWNSAIEANLSILKESPQNVDALMRLAHAYIATGNYKNAKKFAKQVTNLDPLNNIAKKCLTRCASLENGTSSANFGKVSLDNFLEEPGRTKTVTLNHIGTPKTIASLVTGESLRIVANKRQASVQSEKGLHVGHFPDDIAAWIIYHKKQGDSVRAFVKSVSEQGVSVLLKLKTTLSD